MAASKYTVTNQAMEQEWLEVQAAQKDPAKFRVLYSRYYESIFRFIFKRTADEDLTADLTSQAFLKAMQSIQQYTYQGVPFSAWLFRIASNEIAQHFRKNNQSRIVALEDSAVHDVEEEYTEDDKVDLDVDIKLLKEVIQDLDPEEVELLELRFFEKRAFKEVADILDITENNAKVKVYRLLQKMKKRFDKRKI
jgi:RNA polymerase sigma-70 factor (ECF subfamily)